MISECDVFIFYDHVQFDKNSWRNRNRFILHGKEDWLTIPVIADRLSKKIVDTKLYNYSFYYKKFFKKISQNYNRAYNFKNTYNWLVKNMPSKATNVADLNLHLTKEIIKFLGIKVKIYRSSKFINIQDKNENLINIIKRFDSHCYLTGPAALNYIDINSFKKNKIKIKIYNLKNSFLKKIKKNDRFLSILHLMFLYDLKDIFKNE